MKLVSSFLALGLVLVMLPTAAAAPCAADASAIAVGPIYLGMDGTLWQENNPVPGLQRVACEDDNGRSIPADKQLV